MDLMWIIYFIDGFAGNPFPAAGTAFILGFFALVFSLITGVLAASKDTGTSDSEDWENFWAGISGSRPLRWAWVVVFSIWIIGGTLNAIIPEKDTAYKMLAAYGVTELAQNERVQELGGKSLEVLEQAMDKYLKEAEEAESE